MNIKVITRHNPSNYGSLLQSIATIKAIESLGHKCELIDYQRKDERGIRKIGAALKAKADWKNNILKKVAYYIVRFPEEYLAQCKFDKMRSKFLKMTKRYDNKEELASLQSDLFITGSDQVWGPTINGQYDEAYFLSFVKDKNKKRAYAASFGRTEFNEKTIKSYKQLLSGYSSIAVRENSAVELMHNMNIKCIGQVVDPTLLMTHEEWNKYIKKNIKGKYVLVYQLHSNPILDKYAKEFAAHVGLPLYRISPTLHQVFRGGKFIYLPNLGNFLSYIKNCTYFITDSFHGTAFALNFNKQFIEILPNNKTGSRNQSILQLTGLTDRIISNYQDFSISIKNIDYQKVNTILCKEREKSISTLKKLCHK